MKTTFNGMKIPAISPLLSNGEFATDFHEKLSIFSSVFVKQITLVSNNSVLLSELTFMTEERIHLITFSESSFIK